MTLDVKLHDEQARAKTITTEEKLTVVITGPPWPHSGTARVIENQIEYYRERGYSTVFFCVPIDCWYVESYPEWDRIKAGIRELGADRIFFAPIDQRRFVREKYLAWIRHAFRGTALDWIVFTGGSADLSRDAIRAIRDARVALIHVNHIFTLGFARRLHRVLQSDRRVPMILETHDVQANLLTERGDINQWTHRFDAPQRLLEAELSYVNEAQVLVHCSVDDCEFFQRRLPDKPHVLSLPRIDESFIATVNAIRPSGEPIDLLFVGQSTDPNRAAMKWFFEQVWPLIADRGYRIKIVGQVEMMVREYLPEIYRDFRAHFVGPVAELAPFYCTARCVFAPMVSGTGISIKTIEALALGKPFVGTSKAFRGMPMDGIRQAGLRAHDVPQAFADAIALALSNEKVAAQASCAAYARLFSKQAAFSSRDEAFRLATAPGKQCI
jgi:glycosyltransferase involved in cell wall biosynthesis